MTDAIPVFELRGRKLYGDPNQRALQPGDSARCDLAQVRSMEVAIKEARDAGRITVAGARLELATLKSIREAIVKGGKRFAAVRLCNREGELRVRAKADQGKRKKRRAQKQARKTNRPKKRRK